ncbi:hypothetical protein O181_125553, partial [Austropuccinia psidii MF-1]|nr:hypothetical protein [Austropuccinia psidii MF-1]
QFSSPFMASSGHFDPSQTYDGYRAVEVLDPACSECLAKGKDCFQHYNSQSSKCHFASLERNHVLIPGCHLLTSGGIYGVEKMGLLGRSSQSLRHLLLMKLQDFLNVSSEVPISRINTEGVVKRIRRIADSPTDPDAEGSDELDGEGVEVVPHLVGHPSSNSSAQPLANRFQSQVIPSTPRTFQQVLASVPCSASTTHARPSLNPEVRLSPSQKPRNSPITTSQQLQCMASSSRRRDGLSSLVFPATQVFKQETVGLSELTERIQTRQVKNKKLWPDYSGKLI